MTYFDPAPEVMIQRPTTYSPALPPGHEQQYATTDPVMYSVEDFQRMDSDQIKYFQGALAANGYLSGAYRKGGVDSSTADALEAAFGDATANGMTLQEWLRAKGSSDGSSYGAPGGGGSQPYTGPTTTTSTSVSLSTRATARSVLSAALTQQLGRAASNKEVNAFLKGLNVKEKDNPTVTTTTSTPDGHNTNVDSTTKASKIDPTDQAQQWGEKHNVKEGQRFQGAMYVDAIHSMLGMA